MKQVFILLYGLVLFAGNDKPIFQLDDPSKLVYSGTCDEGTTKGFQYAWPNADVVKIVPKSGNIYWIGMIPDTDLVIGSFLQAADAKDKDPVSLTEEDWVGKLKEESPNFYKRYQRQPNDCIDSVPKDEKED